MTGRNAPMNQTNINPPANAFVGREREFTSLDELFDDKHRVVTLWGAGGCGKTRLAIEYAAQSQERYGRRASGGVWWVDCTEAADLESICAVVAGVLRIPLGGQEGAGESVQRIGRALSGRGATLLVLDGLDRAVRQADASVGYWSSAAGAIRFLITSRERMRIPSEVALEVGPMPTDGEGTAPADIPAVRLFVERVRAARPDFELAEGDAEDIADLVSRLEGIPLAIELAASRVDVLGLKGLQKQLSSRLGTLGRAPRDQGGRVRTMCTAIEWSWNLLEPGESVTLMQMSVFQSGFSLEAADAVVDLEGEQAVAMVDVLQTLRDKSLLRTYEPEGFPGAVRFRLYETIQNYALEKLKEEGIAAATLERHARYYLEMARALAEDIGGPDGPEARRRLTLEVDNLMGVLESALAEEEEGDNRRSNALQVAVALEPVFSTRGPFKRYVGVLTRAIEAAAEDKSSVLQADALRARGRIQLLRGEVDGSRTDLNGALEIAQGADNQRLVGSILADLGVTHHQIREMDAARSFYEKAIKVQRPLDDPSALGRVVGNLGALCHDGRQLDEAMGHYDEALTLFRRAGDRRLEGIFTTNLGILEQEQGHVEEARVLFKRARAVLNEVGDKRLVGITAGNLGILLHEIGDVAAARTAHEEALVLLEEVGDTRSAALCMGRLAGVLAVLGQLDEARDKLYEAERILKSLGASVALKAVELHRAFVDLGTSARARASGKGEEAETHVAKARERMARFGDPGPDGEEWAAGVSDDVRSTLRILQAAMAASGADGSGDGDEAVLVLGPDGRYFRPPGGEWQDFRRRGAPRLLLLKLVEAKLERPGVGLSQEELVEAGWPGEQMASDAGANRVYVALTALRQLGLKDALVRQDAGYFLDPALVVHRSEAEWEEIAGAQS